MVTISHQVTNLLETHHLWRTCLSKLAGNIVTFSLSGISEREDGSKID